MLKEQIAGNAWQALKIGYDERSHVSSTREETIPEVSESTPIDRGKKKVANFPKFDIPQARLEIPDSTPQPNVFGELGATESPTGRKVPNN